MNEYQKKYEKSVEDYRKNIETYRKNIEKLMKALMPGVNIPLAVIGFLLTVSGLTPILIIFVNALVLNSPLSTSSLFICFFCYIISFSGYMLIHRSTERDWL